MMWRTPAAEACRPDRLVETRYDTAALMRPRVTAVILNYDTTDDTVACVRSLQRADYDALRILVVDNASPDGGEERLRRALPGVDVRGSGGNLGYTGGVNAGFRMALEQPADYQRRLIPDDETLVVAIEAGRGESLRRFAGRRGLVCGIDRFGASAPYAALAEAFGFTPDAIAARVRGRLVEGSVG